MASDPAASGDSPSFQDILGVLDDDDCRNILRETTEPMTANELSDICDIPKSTLYRKLELLSTASLVSEEVIINPSGGRTTRYERNFDAVTISMDNENEFSVTVKRSSKEVEDRLANIWSKMGDEL